MSARALSRSRMPIRIVLYTTKYMRLQTCVKGLVARPCGGSFEPPRTLLRLDIGLADHLAPLRRVAADAGCEFLRRAGDRVDEARSKHAVAECRIDEDALRLYIDLLHDGGRRAGGCEQPVPGAGLVARQPAFGQRRHVRILRDPAG